MGTLLRRAESVLATPIVSYGAIIALQLRVTWNVWRYMDFTGGDTSSYFVDVASWAHGLHEDIVYSPLYSSVWGTILAIVHDTYAAAIVNRLAIILVVGVLFLAVMRSLFDPAVALLIAIWWAVDPANYNVLYDVHLFGLLPILIAAWIVSRRQQRAALGVALALLVFDALLVRNEVLITSILFGLAVLVHEIRAGRDRRVPVRAYARAYLAPLLVVGLVFGVAYWRSHVQGSEAVALLEAKQETNLCEAYAYSLQQRHPQLVPGEAFLTCERVMLHDFGRPLPSLLAATADNPRAMAGFVGWNARLLPSGLEVALFNATGTGENPGYAPPKQHDSYAFGLGIILLAVLVGGVVVLWREPTFWRYEWLPQRTWTLTLLGSSAIGTLVVVLFERPWAEYMYGLTLGVMVLAGFSLSVLLRRLNGAKVIGPVVGGLALLLIILLPSHYAPAPRPLDDAVGRLQVARNQLQRPRAVLLAMQHGTEICNYLAKNFDHYCTGANWQALRAEASPSAPIQQLLDRAGITVIYAEAALDHDPVISGLLTAPRALGWRQVAGGTGSEGPWQVMTRAGG